MIIKYKGSPNNWNLYLGGNPSLTVEYPDKNAINTILNTDNIPDDYNLFYICFKDKFGEQGESYPIIWKYLTRKDLDNYYEKIKEYLNYIKTTNNVSTGGSNRGLNYDQYNEYLVKPIQYITKNNFPIDFIIISGNEAVHGGWEITFALRNIEIEIAVIENISRSAIQIDKLRYSEISDSKLIPYEVISSKLRSKEIKTASISNSGLLSANEKIIIPLRLSFVNNFNPTKCERPEFKDDKVFLMDAYEGDNSTIRKVYKKRDVMMRNISPSITKRYSYGSSWLLHSLEVDSNLSKIRQANTINLLCIFLMKKEAVHLFILKLVSLVYGKIKVICFWGRLQKI